MFIRKLLYLSGSKAVILPAPIAKALNVGPGDYVEVAMADAETMTVRKQQLNNGRVRNVQN